MVHHGEGDQVCLGHQEGDQGVRGGGGCPEEVQGVQRIQGVWVAEGRIVTEVAECWCLVWRLEEDRWRGLLVPTPQHPISPART